MKFTYTWSNIPTKEEYKKPGRWVCTDGFVKDRSKTYVPNIWRSSQGVDSFQEDDNQDCVVDISKSKITLDDNNIGMFKVHFLRKLMTRGGTKNDAALKVGEKIRLDYGYRNP